MTKKIFYIFTLLFITLSTFVAYPASKQHDTHIVNETVSDESNSENLQNILNELKQSDFTTELNQAQKRNITISSTEKDHDKKTFGKYIKQIMIDILTNLRSFVSDNVFYIISVIILSITLSIFHYKRR